MHFETVFSIGDKGWVIGHNQESMAQVTIGKIQIEFVGASEGIDSSYAEGSVIAYSGGSCSNYGPQLESYVEKYMCYETGIGSGSVYTLGEHIFVKKEDAEIYFGAILIKRALEKIRRKAAEKAANEDRSAREITLARQALKAAALEDEVMK